MFRAKLLNGFGMARMGRFDIEHSPGDDRLIVYVHTDGGTLVRLYINSDGTTESETVSGTTYDDPPAGDAESTTEITIGT